MASDPVIDDSLASRLIAAQFPKWAHLPVKPVARGGWDNRSFRLGDEMLVRMPSSERYAAQVGKEQRWLPRLAPHLPLPIPAPLAMGEASDNYPWRWSVYRWLDGESADAAASFDPALLAIDLARFLRALQAIDARDGPAPGAHNFHRGGALAIYEDETKRAIAALADAIDRDAILALWDAALSSTWDRDPIWIHGDIAAGNLLVKDGRLGAVIDFGNCGVGDPACDLAIAWAQFDREGREAFRAALPHDEATWARGCGWALWKALIALTDRSASQDSARAAMRVVKAAISDRR